MSAAVADLIARLNAENERLRVEIATAHRDGKRAWLVEGLERAAAMAKARGTRNWSCDCARQIERQIRAAIEQLDAEQGPTNG